jgi:hypothetical protein
LRLSIVAGMAKVIGHVERIDDSSGRHADPHCPNGGGKWTGRVQRNQPAAVPPISVAVRRRELSLFYRLSLTRS